MKYAICNETFLDWPFERAMAFAAECGYTGIEFAPFTMASDAREISPARRVEVRRQAAAAGLDVVGLHWLLAKTNGYYLTSPEAEVRRRTADYVRELARLCGDLGGRLMIFGSPLQRNILPGVTPDEAFDYAAQVVQDALPVLEQTGVTLCMEPLGPAEGNFLNQAADAVRLIEKINHPNCRLILDCKAMSSEATPIPEAGPAERQAPGALPRQRSQQARPRLRRARLRADPQDAQRRQLPGLGLGGSLRLQPGRRATGPREHREFAPRRGSIVAIFMPLAICATGGEPPVRSIAVLDTHWWLAPPVARSELLAG